MVANRKSSCIIPSHPGESFNPFDSERPSSTSTTVPTAAGSIQEEPLTAPFLFEDSSRRPMFGKTESGQTVSTGITTHPFENEDEQCERSGSLSNLASFLGSGLVESIDNATSSAEGNNHGPPAGSVLLSNAPDLSYHRMQRHTANRLVGSNNILPLENSDSNTGINHQHFIGGGLFPHTERTGVMYARAPEQPRLNFLTLDHHSLVDSAFPSALATPPRRSNQQPQPHRLEPRLERSTTPVELYPGQHSTKDLPVSINIGTFVVEPEDETSQLEMTSHADEAEEPETTVGSDSNGSLKELARGMKNMWSPEAREFKPAVSGPPSQASSLSEPGTDITPRQAEAELSLFLWDVNSSNPSRTLAILRVAWLRIPDILVECERFGALESFRVDFLSRGIVFASYYDIRSAQYASKELQPQLQRLSVMQGSSDEVMVHFCLPLNSSSQFDESRIQLSNVPPEINEYSLKSWLSSYGSLRSLVLLRDNVSYIVEYHNIQDAKQALLELESSKPMGPQVLAEVCVRESSERKKGRELLSMISRWRPMLGPQGGSIGGSAPFLVAPNSHSWSSQPRNHLAPHSHDQTKNGQREFATTGLNGRYTDVVMTNHVNGIGVNQNYQSHGVNTLYNAQNPQTIVQSLNGQYYVTHSQQQSGGAWSNSDYVSSHMSAGSRNDRLQTSTYGDPQHTTGDFRQVALPHRIPSDATTVSGRTHHSSQHSTRSGYSVGTTEESANKHLALDLEAVEEGIDTRTSLMVRNIPNKYTQQMLLSEFEDNGHGPGVIDFFYLPIDFKNRCNRGYAFINFVDFKDILDFHRRYFGKHWRTFNSDKICDITYARIQGKEAMLKRFQNSALMEKDDEYKPLVFTSHGHNKGQRLQFPNTSRYQDPGRVEV